MYLRGQNILNVLRERDDDTSRPTSPASIEVDIETPKMLMD